MAAASKQDVQIQQATLQGERAKMAHTISSGISASSSLNHARFLIGQKVEKERPVRDALIRGIDLIRAMGIVRGFKKSIESTIESMQIDVSTLGFEFYQSMKSCALKVLDPTGAIQKVAMQYIDEKLRDRVSDPSDLSFIYQVLCRSLKLKNSDPEGYIWDMKLAYVEEVNSDTFGRDLKAN